MCTARRRAADIERKLKNDDVAMNPVRVIGAGLAGCEAANTLTASGYDVILSEMKPLRRSPAHTSDDFCELVCSNSLKADRINSAAGLLKAEMRRMGSLTVGVADDCRVAAGGALAVDRELFSREVTKRIKRNPRITIHTEEMKELDLSVPTIIATGPLTDGVFADYLTELTGGFLSFYDAAAPIIMADSLDRTQLFSQSRYDYDSEGDYLNAFFDKAGYEQFWNELISAETAPLHEFEGDNRVYEGCMPVERLASRGADAIRFGPLKPVGLRDPRTGHRPWAAVQLRKEDAAGRLYNIVGFQTNLKFSEQKRVFGMIPGLENAEFARFGVMHRNSFLNSPKLLNPTLNLKKLPNIYVAGQLTGFEGYMESAASGILAARFLATVLQDGIPEIPGENTMCGALLRYITAESKDFQPMGANMGILPPLDIGIKDKRKRYAAFAERALEQFDKEFL